MMPRDVMRAEARRCAGRRFDPCRGRMTPGGRRTKRRTSTTSSTTPKSKPRSDGRSRWGARPGRHEAQLLRVMYDLHQSESMTTI
jgi:hypothetical protein